MRLLGLLTVVVVAAATLATAPLGATLPKHQIDRSVAVQVNHLRGGIRWQIGRTWYWQDQLGVGRTPSAHAERHVRAVGYLRWDLWKWSQRRARARHRFLSDRLPTTGDWETAVRIVQRTWPGTSAFLLSCSGAESSHGIWVWNGGKPYSAGGTPTSYSIGYRTPPYGSSGAGGWMQFMEGTWSGQYNGALALARQEHLPIPMRRDALWTSPVGQAFAAGWGYSHARSAWTGDPACA